MSLRRFILTTVCIGFCLSTGNVQGQGVTFGTWLEEDLVGIHSVTGSGDSFTASPTTIPTADDGDNFAQRNAERQRVYQVFSEALDFAAEGDEVHVTFDVTFAGPVKNLDSDFRMSLVDTSTNQGFYPVSWDTGVRSGTYNRARFVDNLDGGADPFEPHGGAFNDAINASGTVAQAGGSPTENNGAVAEGLVDGNTVSFSVVMTRDAGDSLSFTTNATESNGDVIYAETAGSYNMVTGSGGDTSIRGEAINSFDGIVFGLFDDDPYDDYSGDASYTVSNICVSDTAPGVVLLTETFEYPDGILVGNAAWVGYGSDQRQEVMVESGQAVIAGDGIQDVNIPFGGAPGILYYSIEFSVDDLGMPYPLDENPDFEYFVTFYDGNGGDNLSARIDIQAPNGAGDFTVGIASDQGTADATWPTDLSYDTVYRGVVSYDQVNNLAQLWIDPVVESDTSILGENRLATEGIGGDTPTAVALRQATSDGLETIRVDNLLIGTSFKSVTPPTALVGDFDGNGVVDCDDLDGYVGNIGAAAAGALAALDIDSSGTLEPSDATSHITTLVVTSNGVTGTFPGDLNCDGVVNVLGDAFPLVANLNGPATSYAQGDINFDGTVNVLGDAFILVANLGNSNDP